MYFDAGCNYAKESTTVAHWSGTNSLIFWKSRTILLAKKFWRNKFVNETNSLAATPEATHLQFSFYTQCNACMHQCRRRYVMGRATRTCECDEHYPWVAPTLTHDTGDEAIHTLCLCTECQTKGNCKRCFCQLASSPGPSQLFNVARWNVGGPGIRSHMHDVDR